MLEFFCLLTFLALLLGPSNGYSNCRHDSFAASFTSINLHAHQLYDMFIVFLMVWRFRESWRYGMAKNRIDNVKTDKKKELFFLNTLFIPHIITHLIF